eukprot:937652-Rhodomonas_salina.1
MDDLLFVRRGRCEVGFHVKPAVSQRLGVDVDRARARCVQEAHERFQAHARRCELDPQQRFAGRERLDRDLDPLHILRHLERKRDRQLLVGQVELEPDRARGQRHEAGALRVPDEDVLGVDRGARERSGGWLCGLLQLHGAQPV